MINYVVIEEKIVCKQEKATATTFTPESALWAEFQTWLEAGNEPEILSR